MNRTINAVWKLAGVLTLGALAVAFAVSGQQGEKLRGQGWRVLEPVTYENMSVFPVVASNTRATDGFVTLDEALASGAVTVSERGSDTMRRTRDGRSEGQQYQQSSASVNQLVLINHGNKPLILLAGEMVSGGKQDRIIAKDRIVPVGAEPLPLDVFCVEHGRWSSGADFSAANTMVHPSVREKAAVDQAQTEVWSAVRAGTTAAPPAASGGGGGSASVSVQVETGGQQVMEAPRLSSGAINATFSGLNPTQSYKGTYSSGVVNRTADPFVDEIQRRFAKATAELKGERVIGVVIAYGGEVAWSDVFASPQLFERYWPKLLRSYVVEALARPGTKEVATLADAQEFLRPLKGTEKEESEPDVYRWKEVTQGRYVAIELQALKPTDILLHSLTIHKTGGEYASTK
jgi:hypothetical protein